MRSTVYCACVLALTGFTGAVSAQSYMIRVKFNQDPGKTVTHRKGGKTTNLLKILDPSGKLLNEDKEVEEDETVYTSTILEKGDPLPKKYKRTYDKAVTVKNGETNARSYQGRVIIFELKEGKYQARAEGEPALGEDSLKELADGANGAAQQEYYPVKPVKVGEVWPVDPKVIAKDWDKDPDSLDLKKTKGEGKLLKVFKKDGVQFGIIEITLALALKRLPGMTLDRPTVMRVKSTTETAIDGSVAASTSTEVVEWKDKVGIEVEGKKLIFDVNLQGAGKTHTTAPK